MEEENRNLLNPIASHDKKRLDKEDSDALTSWYSFTKGPLLEFVEVDSGRVWTAKQRVELNVLLRWIATLLNLDSAKEVRVGFRIRENNS